MNQESRADVADVLAAAGRHWGWMLTFGAVTLVIGVMVLAWPDSTLVVIAALFGIQLVVAGIFRFVLALAADDQSGLTRVMFALLGVLAFIVGLYALRNIMVTITALALLLGIYWIVNGAVELFTALANREAQGRGWAMVMGLLGIVAGVVVLVYPGMSLQALLLVLGIWLVVLGAMQIFVAFQIRSAGRTTARIAPAV
ncbi:HdeD family acid-resistance protein [Planobispora takensis]|uniref:HdeD family acid-resistance protein n=1 Tax=Planobispora takensis TaxID=1367882 RepID=A0A8J3T5V6_9ACTN|nr:HdeD family acid-resistance protein [Planobispora takensis]GII04981.1 hypothetical protein Pta02_69890 [Planobispora takensis]